MFRVTKEHLEAKIRIVNGQLGFDVDKLEYNTVGSIQLYCGNGFYGVHRVANSAHGVKAIMEGGNARQANEFLRGMIEALRIIEDDSK